MTIKLKVPTIKCEGCAEIITEALLNAIADAKVAIDVDSKVVVVETQASEASIKQAITSAGHEID